MVMSRKNAPKPFLIDDETLNDPAVRDRVFVPTVAGEMKGHGLVPRDLNIHPPGMFPRLPVGDAPGQMRLIQPSEYDARLEEEERDQTSLEHIRGDIPALDQNGQGFCWAYSTGSAITLLQRKMNQPYVRLSPHAVACKIKNFRDEGGWCGLSAKFARENGYPDVTVWPEKSMSRSNDNAATWANAKTRLVTEDWCDLSADVYDQNLTVPQLYTCLLLAIPCMVDFNWWSHSVCAIRLVKVEAGSYGIKILNSWTDQWGERGTGILRGSKGVPNGAVALRVSGAAA